MKKCKFYLNDRAKLIDWVLDDTGWIDGNDPKNVIMVIEDQDNYFHKASYSDEEKITAIVDNILSGCYYWYGWTPTLSAIKAAIETVTNGVSAVDKAWHFSVVMKQKEKV